MSNKTEKKEIKVNINQDVANGKYANIMATNFSKEEFILDFGFVQPQTQQANMHSRVILTPQNAELLLNLLAENVNKHKELEKKTSNKNIELSIN
ncbi:DUF3467 domain-containing protein [Candidatus Marinamargulisbacteria bacterium SCGC AG-343-D04]|nr:DUF3467 domain-containing protein [Candidatus Marinamargulisbacteria bacterium SCGC AG-343-D04]